MARGGCQENSRAVKPRRRRYLRSTAIAAALAVVGISVVIFDVHANRGPSIQAQAADHQDGDSLAAGNGTTEAAPPLDPAMPVGDLPGWKQVFTDDFTSGDVPVGSFPGDAYKAKWSANYADGTPDTSAQIQGTNSGYYPSKVLSVKDGMLDMYLHSENGTAMGAAPAPVIPGINPNRPNSLLYGRYSVRFRTDPGLQGFKIAWLLWPDSGIWPRDGEIDYPEGYLTDTFYGAAHPEGPGPYISDVISSGATFTSWHIATLEWSPGRVEFFLDGHSIGVSTNSIPSTPMHYILQTESCLKGCPAPGVSGHVYVDWVAIWAKE